MTTIPLNKLTPAKANVRKTGTSDGIGELAASIAAHGLLASLVVKKATRGKFAVVAGQRRYQALKALAATGKIPDDLPVSCHLLEDSADAVEIGLAENVLRIAMHPADQFEAFRQLLDKDSSAADVAARFGVSEAIVTRRMKLGRVSPRILDAYRAGELGLEQVKAYALSDDQAAQEALFAASPASNPYSIRQALTEGELPATDRRVRFVGLEAYEAAGGRVRRDLFDDRNSGYVLDIPLLDRLVGEGLEAQAEAVRAEGWSWVEARPEFGYAEYAEFRRCQPEDIELPEAEAAELDRLRDEHNALLDTQYDEDGEEDAGVTERLEAMGQRLAELEDMAQGWTPEQMAVAGAVVTLEADGSIEVKRGLIRPEDALEAPASGTDGETDGDGPSPAPTLPATLIATLTAQKTAALRATIAQQPEVALAAVTHALARSAFYRDGGDSCLDIATRQRLLTTPLAQPDACGGLSAFDAERARWADRLPGDADALFAWCLRQTQETLIGLLAASAAHTLDAVRDKGMREDAPGLLHAEAMADALRLDMGDWFTPTAANYFGRVNRTLIVEALTEAGLPPCTRRWAKLKKGELAALAERDLTGTGWLPQPLCRRADAVQPDEAQADMPAAAAA